MLVLDMVPSSSADWLLARFVDDLFVSIRFKAKRNLQRLKDVLIDILISKRQKNSCPRCVLIQSET